LSTTHKVTPFSLALPFIDDINMLARLTGFFFEETLVVISFPIEAANRQIGSFANLIAFTLPRVNNN